MEKVLGAVSARGSGGGVDGDTQSLPDWISDSDNAFPCDLRGERERERNYEMSRMSYSCGGSRVVIPGWGTPERTHPVP